GDRVNDRARISWGLSTHAPRTSIGSGFWLKIAAICRSAPGGRFYRALNNYLVPALVIIVLGTVLTVAALRAAFTVAVGTGNICVSPYDVDSDSVGATPTYAKQPFDVSNMCWRTGFQVEKGRKYIIGIEMNDRWFDHTIIASPYGFANPDAKFSM